MRFAAILLCVAACVPAMRAQQQPAFKAGDAVDFYTFGKWIPCTVESSIAAGSYNVRCGSIELRAKSDPRELRAHIAPPPGLEAAFGVQSAADPVDSAMSIGARYGTRDPRDCNHRPDQFSAADAKDIFICDAEHEFDGSLYLVSEVSLEVAKSRPFDPVSDAAKQGIDRSQPVFDLLVTYNDFQCSPIPATHFDNPNNRNCNESRATQAAGSCFRNAGGEWHCLLAGPGAGTVATAKNVAPPTLVD